MKVINLLNKIANKECNNNIKFKYRGGIYDIERFEEKYVFNYWSLNKEIEIIEENNKIEYIGKEYDLTKFYNDYKEPAILLRDMSNKLKEIIDKINKTLD